MSRAARFVIGLVAVAFLIWPVLLLPGCSLSREQRARTALDALAIAAEGASHAAELVCEQRGKAVIARAADPAVPPDTARAELADVHERCDATRDAFGTLRQLHAQAAAAVEGGLLDRAEALLELLRTRWRELGGAP